MKTFFSSYPRLWVYLLLLLLAVAHFPFLNADADEYLSWSRAPWSDEGLYSCQVINYIEHGHAGMDQSDGLIKTPLLGAVLYGGYKVFGISMLSGRLVVLCTGLLLLAYAASSNKYLLGFIAISLPVVFLEYFTFHYAHLALSEVLASICILLGIVLLYQSLSYEPFKLRFQVASALLFGSAYFLKIQYAYIVFLAPLYLLIAMLYFSFVQRSIHKQYLNALLINTGTQVMLGVMYYLLWYLPNKKLMDHVMADQTGNRYVTWDLLGEQLQRYYNDIFMQPELQFFTYLFYLSLLIGAVLVFSKQSNPVFKIIFPLLCLWIVLELHKLPMIYLPSRYLASSYVAMGLIIALVTRECIYRFSSTTLFFKLAKSAFVLMAACLCYFNGKDYIHAFQRRTYTVSMINRDLQDVQLVNRPIVGPWAPTLNWTLKGYSFPVWYEYFNDKDLIETHNPKVIVSELNEDDSGLAYKNRGINLDSLAQEIRYYQLSKWKIKVIVLK